MPFGALNHLFHYSQNGNRQYSRTSRAWQLYMITLMKNLLNKKIIIVATANAATSLTAILRISLLIP